MEHSIFEKSKVETVKTIGVVTATNLNKSSLVYISDSPIKSRLPSEECDTTIYGIKDYKFLGHTILYYEDKDGKWITLKELVRMTGRSLTAVDTYFRRTKSMIRVGIYDNGSHGGRPTANLHLAHVRQNLVPLELGLHYFKTRPELKVE